METKTGEKNQAITGGREGYTTGSVISKDGTTIGYRQYGHGPGIVVVHGSMSSAYSHHQLAEALAGSFTVYLLDRRGRGLSSPHHNNYSIQTELEDLDALLTETGAHYIFGVSSGGIICLKAALGLPAVHKAAIYEPPLFANDTVPKALLARFDRELAQSKVATALIAGMKGAQMGPGLFNAMPYWMLEPLVNMAMKSEEKKGSGGYVSMRALAPTLHYDFQLVAEMSGKIDSFRAMQPDLLLLGGSKSPAYLKAALDALEKVLPQAKRIEFAGLGHGAALNTDRTGKPELVAQELRRFFA